MLRLSKAPSAADPVFIKPILRIRNGRSELTSRCPEEPADGNVKVRALIALQRERNDRPAYSRRHLDRQSRERVTDSCLSGANRDRTGDLLLAKRPLVVALQPWKMVICRGLATLPLRRRS